MLEPPNFLRVKVASPDGLALDVAATCVELQTVEGIIQVLPGHAPLVAALFPGELLVTEEDGKVDAYVTGGGFVEIEQDHMTLLTDLARPEDALEETAIQEAIERSSRELEESDDSGELEILELHLLEAKVQMDIFKKRRGARR